MSATCPSCLETRATNRDGSIRRHGCEVIAPGLVSLPWAKPHVTKNQIRRMHHHAEARARREVIAEARWLIRAAHLTPVEYADVILHWRVPNRVRRDGDGAYWLLSALIDALVLEGVLPDDNWACVRHSGVTCHPPQPGMPGGMWLSVSPAREEA